MRCYCINAAGCSERQLLSECVCVTHVWRLHCQVLLDYGLNVCLTELCYQCRIQMQNVTQAHRLFASQQDVQQLQTPTTHNSTQPTNIKRHKAPGLWSNSVCCVSQQRMPAGQAACNQHAHDTHIVQSLVATTTPGRYTHKVQKQAAHLSTLNETQ